MEDWSLQAIVRGSSGEFGMIGDMEVDGPDSFLTSDHQLFDHNFRASFPDIFESFPGSSGDELEELYKPFYPATSLPDHTAAESQPQNADQSDQSSVSSPVAGANPVYTPKYKKRKNQHKRVVIQVSAENLSSDMWAWRKYGQKPIKGSPYPRSYYRCSSSKGCLARKQVEQSCTDPGMFIITYTAEHSHSQPTRRNSLAGTVRQKFPSPKQAEKSQLQQQTEMNMKPRVKVEEKAHSSDDFVFNEDFFSGLEEFDEFAQPFRSRPCSWA
ncbi:WRKY transcription factor 22-like [Salvia hispanica]|uniref:WRKY transcription factor 22-like n=1 Tax=Salvia hispanica TaxID=49212 RepID=UPI002008FF62|nr:WRKY transcription factor 22-like [Salvia hispanica]